jgi:hypothetical protein
MLRREPMDVGSKNADHGGSPAKDAGLLSLDSWRLRVRIPLGYDYLSLVSVVFCQVEVSVTGLFLVQRSSVECVCVYVCVCVSWL